STDYLERFKLFDKMKEDAIERANGKASAAVAAILMQSEFVKKAGEVQNAATKSKWKMRGTLF
ncbi:MAG: acetyl-CoA carboxylase biotin carboxylase subunit, partial [Nitrososphaera sp.]